VLVKSSVSLSRRAVPLAVNAVSRTVLRMHQLVT